jgi:hypothetical protein
MTTMQACRDIPHASKQELAKIIYLKASFSSVKPLAKNDHSIF